MTSPSGSNLSKSQINWINSCLRILEKHNSFGRVKIIAVAIKSGRIIGIGYNYFPCRRPGRGIYNLMGTHAEADLLSKYDVSNCTVYIVGRTNSNILKTTKPCPRCNNLLINSKVKQIIYRDTDGNWVQRKRTQLEPQFIKAITV